MEELPDDVESLPGSMDSLPGSVDSLPDCDNMEPLPGSVDSPDESDAEVVSLVVPVPGNAHLAEQKDVCPGRCRAQNCLHVIETECAAELHELLALKRRVSTDDLNESIFKLLLVTGRPHWKKDAWRVFQLFGTHVCRKGFLECLGVGQGRLIRSLHWLKEGHSQPPRDLRHSSAAERNKAGPRCGVALRWAYDVLAETFNNSDVHPADCDVDAPAVPDAAEPSFLAMPTLGGFCAWVHGPSAAVTATCAGSGAVVKMLPPVHLCDHFENCKLQMQCPPQLHYLFPMLQ